MRVSVLLPTRSRPDAFRTTVAALRDNAVEPDAIEIIARVDSDTTDADYVRATGAQVLVGAPLGYVGMNTYINEAAAMATGDWLFIYNDDAVMQTQGWDAMLGESRWTHLLVGDAFNGPAYCVFPIIPRMWATACGHVSPHAHVDTHRYYVAQALGWLEQVPITVLHDRFDLTGRNDDAVYRARAYQGFAVDGNVTRDVECLRAASQL